MRGPDDSLPTLALKLPIVVFGRKRDSPGGLKNSPMTRQR